LPLARHCPKCDTLVPEDAAFCSNCGYVLRPEQLSASPSYQSTSPSWTPSYPQPSDLTKRYADFGLISAILSLFIVPEIFGSAAIILGAYAWKMEREGSNRGLFIIVLGIVCMLVGIYLTSLFELGDLIP
jgi:hypothetical protein